MALPENVALVVAPEAQLLAQAAGAPRLSQAPADVLHTVAILDEGGVTKSIQVPNERVLRVVVDGQELVSLLTLGAAPEWLVLGYLRNQRIVDSVTALESVTVDWASHTAMVKSRSGTALTTHGQSGSGLSGCGIGSELADLRIAPPHSSAARAGASISRPELLEVLETMRQFDAVHRASGSVHSSALFRGAQLLLAVEDVSRHNGIDTVTGWMAQHGAEGSDKVLFTTGRLTGEMVLKAAHNGIPIVISRNGVTALSIDIAERFAMTLVGRAVNRRFVCYAGAAGLRDA